VEVALIIWLARLNTHPEFNGCAGESIASASDGDIPTRPESSLVKLILAKGWYKTPSFKF
jgi:hypothetical protein